MKQNFKALRDHWYKKLAEAGFKDIELGNSHPNPYRNIECDILRVAKEEYWQVMEYYVNHEKTIYRSEIDRIILELYSRGNFIREICAQLRRLGIPRDRGTVSDIIKRYERAWGIG